MVDWLIASLHLVAAFRPALKYGGDGAGESVAPEAEVLQVQLQKHAQHTQRATELVVRGAETY